MTCDGNHPGREAHVGAYEPGMCRLCWLNLNQGIGGVSTRGQVPQASSLQKCCHLGAATGEMVKCPTCLGDVHLKVFGCEVHEKCTVGKEVPGVACCKTCPDYKVAEIPSGITSPPESISRFGLQTPTVRNLLYHVYPLRGPGWRWNVMELKKRIGLFNGRRIVAVAVDYGNCDGPDEVKKLLGDEVDEVFHVTNRPELREVATFEALFERVQSLHPGHVTFYGHTKGVTRGGMATSWTKLLYEMNLDYYPHVEDTLRRYSFAGGLKKVGRGWPSFESLSTWHYSGSFYWFRNRDLFSKPDWRRIDRCWTGIEPYPSLHFPSEEAGCLFWEKSVLEANYYDTQYISKVVWPAWEVWKAANAHLRLEVKA